MEYSGSTKNISRESFLTPCNAMTSLAIAKIAADRPRRLLERVHKQYAALPGSLTRRPPFLHE